MVGLLNKVPTYYFILYGIFSHGISSYLGVNAIFVITLLLIERWLHVSRNPIFTIARTYKAYIVICLLPIPIVVSNIAQSLDGWFSPREVVVEGIVVLLSVFVTFIFYFKDWKIILRHQNQVRVNQQTQNFGHSSIDLAG